MKKLISSMLVVSIFACGLFGFNSSSSTYDRTEKSESVLMLRSAGPIRPVPAD